MTHKFRVWAPLAQRVEIKVGPKRHPMAKSSGGWWTTEVPASKKRRDYGFILDGRGPFPDPRSPWQPAGVHGLSRSLDHDAFAWTDAGWQSAPLSAAVIYELHVGTFTPQGTFEAAIKKLDHLSKLGVTHVELMPVNEFPGERNWGYDGADLFAPHHAYGGPDGFKRLVNACHRRKLAVLLDVVYNHLGPSGNYLGKFGPYFTSRYSSPWGSGINFDGPDSDEVRRLFCDNALMWLRDYHVDGLRLDAVHAIVDTSAIPFLEQLKREVEELAGRLGRRLVLIAESDLNDPRLLWPRSRGGFGLDAQWSDDFHHALHAVLTGEQDGYYADFGQLTQLCQALGGAFVYDGQFSPYRHRSHGRRPDGLSGHQFLAYLQNHDQIGNRAVGERSCGLMSRGRLKIGAALVFTSPFVPMLFQGEEWGASTPFQYFTDYPEPKLAKGVRDGRCREFAAFGWKAKDVPDPQARQTFERSKLKWSELGHRWHAEMFDWHRRLIRLRHKEPDLADGRRDRVRTRCDEQNHWLTVQRGDITVACNLGKDAQVVPLPRGKHRLLMASDSVERRIGKGMNLPPDSVAIMKRIKRS